MVRHSAIPQSPALRFLVTMSLISLTALSCSSPVEPRAGVTLLVTNGTCVPGPCSSQEILAFPGNQPHTPGGYWSLDLGTLSASELCVTIPATATFRIIGVNSDGSADTTKVTWTSAMPLALGAQPPSDSRILASPSTSGFVPATSTGWTVTLPNASAVVPATPCGP